MVKVITFGCKYNLLESEIIKHCNLPDDCVVVNTCTVTGEADRQCRQEIRKQHRNTGKKIIVTGCGAVINKEKFEAMEEVFKVVDKKDLLEGKIVEGFEHRVRAYLPIQTGCSYRCTFCIVPYARGNGTSYEIPFLLNKAKEVISQGFKEIDLTGINIASYKYSLTELVRRLSELEGLKRLRLGSLDPALLDDEFVALFNEDNAILMPHIHLSIQSGDNMILKRMGRRHNREKILDLRDKLPNVTFGADIIAGFPTETEEMFNNSVKIVNEAKITHGHIFPYSEREGTPAALMPQIDKKIRKDRAKILREEVDKNLNQYLEEYVGKTCEVLVEDKNKGFNKHYITVKLKDKYEVGEFVNVKVLKSEDSCLIG